MVVTIKDVAKHAGVSIGTVSRALNNYSDISEKTKNRILKSVQELGYTRNLIGRGLSSKEPTYIGVIISGLLDSSRYDNHWSLILQGVYRYAFEVGLEVSVYATDSSHQKQKSYASFCKERNIAGVILSGITTTDEYFKELVQSSIPCVVLDVPVVANMVACVSIDNIAAMRDMMELLISKGNKRFCVVSGKKNAVVALERMAGIQNTLRDHDIPLLTNNVLYCDFSEEIAYEQVRAFIKSNKKSVDTFVCMSDIMAVGAIRAIQDEGYSVPEDFNVTGFDDIPLASYFNPSLTTIKQDVSLGGYEGAKLLRRIMGDISNVDRLLLNHSLVVRGSVKI